VPPTVRAMIEVQRLCDCGPQDVVGMRAIDIDRSGAVWEYRPRRYKTEHKNDGNDPDRERVRLSRSQGASRPQASLQPQRHRLPLQPHVGRTAAQGRTAAEEEDAAAPLARQAPGQEESRPQARRPPRPLRHGQLPPGGPEGRHPRLVPVAASPMPRSTAASTAPCPSRAAPAWPWGCASSSATPCCQSPASPLSRAKTAGPTSPSPDRPGCWSPFATRPPASWPCSCGAMGKAVGPGTPTCRASGTAAPAPARPPMSRWGRQPRVTAAAPYQ
jgi:hypothetical protein